MNMKTIVLSFIVLCAMDVWASLSYSEATTTVGETTYNTHKAVRKSGLMIIIAGSAEATVEDQSQEAQLSRNYGCLSLV